MSEASVSAGSCYQTPGPLAAHESSPAVGKRETCRSVNGFTVYTRTQREGGYAMQVLHRADSRSVLCRFICCESHDLHNGFGLFSFEWEDTSCSLHSHQSPQPKEVKRALCWTKHVRSKAVFRGKMWHLEICIVEASGAVGFFSLFIYIFLVIIVSDQDVD